MLMNWFVIRTKPRQEWKAKQNLENQHFEVYLPELALDTGKVEPLFPGYIFLKNQAAPTPFEKIRFTKGVLNYVRFGNQVALAKQALIDSLVDRENEFKHISTLTHNQKVVIKDGPFKDVQAIYLNKSGKDRVVLLLKILNTKQEVEMERANIESA